MKRSLSLLILLSVFVSRSQVISYNMSNTSTVVPCGSTFNFYDSGGPGSPYSPNENFTLTLSASGAGSCLTISFSSFATQSGQDILRIYDGSNVGAPLLGSFSGNTIPGPFASSSGSLTFVFTSNNSNQGAGWQALVQCTACPPPPTVDYTIAPGSVTVACPSSGIFYDTGGPSLNYLDNQNITETFYAPAGSCLSYTFTSFSTESCCDRLRIFDGPSGASPLIGIYSGVAGPGVVNSSGTSLTFSFTSDGSINSTGWAASYACVAPCAGVPVAGTAIASPSINCTTFTSNLSMTGNAAGCGLTYQWQSSGSIGGPYTNLPGLTSTTANVTSTVTTYYRCQVSCGGSSAFSSPATCSITAVGICGLCSINSVVLPYNSGAQTNCGNGNNVTSGNVTNICGSSLYYGGEDAVYSFTPLASGALTVGVTSAGSYMGLTVYNGCPVSGGSCMGAAQSFAGTQTLCITVTMGQVYYVIIDSWPSPNCNPYNLSISAPGPCVGSVAGVTAVATPSSACGTLVTNLSLSGLTACGPTYQWQVSLAVGGPYTNVVGGNGPTLSATTSVSNFYQCVLSCGGSSALTTVAATSVTPLAAPLCNLSSYAASAITYSFESFVGTLLPSTDDVLFNGLSTFGFPFCFSGQQMTGGYVASNSAFVFDAYACNPNIYAMPGAVNAAPGIGTGWSINLPAPTNADNTPRNAILAPWHDSDPGVGGTMRYITLGVAPNRRYIVSWENVPMFSCNAMLFSGQIKLFETSGIIEIHIGNKPICATWNNGRAIMGLHNYDGTIYSPPVNATAHNSPTQWSMSNTAYRWVSSCPSVSNCNVPLPIGFKNIYGQQIEAINKLWWETSEESNIKEYIIERSLDAYNFNPIGSESPKGVPSTYLFNDNTFQHGFVNYYKVTAVEKDGKKTSTSIYAIFNTEDKVIIKSIYPNPAKDLLSIAMEGRGINADCSFIIYDQFGKTVMKNDQKISYGSNLANINIEALEPGIYVIEIKTLENTLISRQKFSKQ